jgi:hypothetical protein
LFPRTSTSLQKKLTVEARLAKVKVVLQKQTFKTETSSICQEYNNNKNNNNINVLGMSEQK